MAEDNLHAMEPVFTFKDARLQIEPYALKWDAIQEDVVELETRLRDFDKVCDLGGIITISRPRLRSVVMSWRHDLNRYKAFHLECDPNNPETEPYPDKYKQAAYLAYWLSKIKPFSAPQSIFFFKYNAINEVFAIHVATQGYLGIDPKEISDERFRNLVRQLYYRDTNPKQLASTLEELYGHVTIKRGIIDLSEKIKPMLDADLIKKTIADFTNEIHWLP